MRAFSDVDALEMDVSESFDFMRSLPGTEDGTDLDHHIACLETFAAIAFRVLRKTNPSKLRSEARTVEIYARMNGIPVVNRKGEVQ